MYLVMMKGMPGSGKTTLSRALGQQLGWPVVDKDMFRPILPDGALAYQVMFLLSSPTFAGRYGQTFGGGNGRCDSLA